MFSGNLKILISLLGIAGGLFIISKFKYLVLFISWSVIVFCFTILYIKANSKNKKLQERIDKYFKIFMSSKFVKFIIKMRDKFNKEKSK